MVKRNELGGLVVKVGSRNATGSRDNRLHLLDTPEMRLWYFDYVPGVFSVGYECPREYFGLSVLGGEQRRYWVP